MGTRLALGAGRGDIIRLVLWHTAMLTGGGIAAGLAGGLVAARSLGAMLHGVPPWDPLVVAGAAAVLTATALFAGYLPARRAATVDPARTLAAD
jgi:ABC-type antimicrobial peptide transport system permease subunit